VPRRSRAPFVALTTLLHNRFPSIVDLSKTILGGHVLVDGAPVTNPRSRVRTTSSVRVLAPKPLRGALKLRGALRELHLSVNGMVALDLGAAAGGFTQALLEAGAARVYAVDAGSGQLRGWLRADPRVVDLERTNLADVGPDLVHEPVDLVTIDLSYLALADALPQIDPAVLAPAATVLALVKPTYELRAGALAADPQSVADAIEKVSQTVIRLGWSVTATVPSCLRGSRGATEVFMQTTPRPRQID
jgi:23S rRNA (cytidine1920-2'-O)/16S rRNA (cytidine1409-2'-O)-methyltransferase